MLEVNDWGDMVQYRVRCCVGDKNFQTVVKAKKRKRRKRMILIIGFINLLMYFIADYSVCK